MLTRPERIKYSGLFTQAFQKGRSLKSKNFKIQFTKSLEQYSSRLPLCGFVVSKNFSKKAVLRNRIKRQIREIYRLYRLKPNNAEKLKKIGLLIFVVKVDSGHLDASYQELKRELEALLNRI